MKNKLDDTVVDVSGDTLSDLFGCLITIGVIFLGLVAILVFCGAAVGLAKTILNTIGLL